MSSRRFLFARLIWPPGIKDAFARANLAPGNASPIQISKIAQLIVEQVPGLAIFDFDNPYIAIERRLP